MKIVTTVKLTKAYVVKPHSASGDWFSLAISILSKH